MPPPQEVRPCEGIINHHHPFIKPIKPVFAGGRGIGEMPECTQMSMMIETVEMQNIIPPPRWAPYKL